MSYTAMMRPMGLVAAGLAMWMVSTAPAQALVTFQAYIQGATAGDLGGEDDTWFADGDSITLVVVGAYGPNTTSLTNTTLVVAVPQGETGTLSVSNNGDGVPPLLTVSGSNGTGNPLGNADANLLMDVGGLDGYQTVANFTPAGLTFSSHAPTGDGESDFVLFALGSFGNAECNLNNYDAAAGISATSACGEQKSYLLSAAGFSRLHFDVYGLDTVSQGNGGWVRNPGSHDATWNPSEDPQDPTAPEPSSLSLLGIGLAALWRRRRRA